MKWKRTDYCGVLGPERTGDTVVLNGWVHRRRDHGGVIFIDLRDRTGLCQVVFNPDSPELLAEASRLRAEYVVGLRGTVVARSPETVNPKIATGAIEVRPSDMEILNQAKTPPISPADEIEPDEMLRLKYRYLDLRRPHMQEILRLRHRVVMKAREFLDRQGFLEIETPMLTRSTPEGARDYLVPSRMSPGHFFALPQSPQLFKQLLMVGGVDRYFQIARCFRDEDLRADRQPEFTQIDAEMSFVEAEDVMSLFEAMIREIFATVTGLEVPSPLPRLTHQEAMDRYGTDRPDRRFGMEIKELSALAERTGFGIFRSALESGGRVRGLALPGGAALSRREIDSLVEAAKAAGAGGLAWIARDGDGFRSPFAKFAPPEVLADFADVLELGSEDLGLIVADKLAVVRSALGSLRLELAERFHLIPSGQTELLWVTDFPLLEFDATENRYVAVHHPFTSPREEDWEKLESEPLAVRAQAYDLVMNGTELGGGSIRIHRPDQQERIFKLLGLSPEESHEKFGFLLEAFQYGAPPHGGLAFGLDRMVMLLAGAKSVRDTIAFPKNARAVCPLTEAPGSVAPEQLAELNLRVVAQIPLPPTPHL